VTLVSLIPNFLECEVLPVPCRSLFSISLSVGAIPSFPGLCRVPRSSGLEDTSCLPAAKSSLLRGLTSAFNSCGGHPPRIGSRGPAPPCFGLVLPPHVLVVITAPWPGAPAPTSLFHDDFALGCVGAQGTISR